MLSVSIRSTLLGATLLLAGFVGWAAAQQLPEEKSPQQVNAPLPAKKKALSETEPAHESGPLLRPSCRDVLREVNRDVNERDGNPASPRAVARRTGLETQWVLRCMEAYGRVPSERSLVQDTDREAFERALEEGRPIETDEDNRELTYDKDQQLVQEHKTLRQRRKVMVKEKKAEQAAESFEFPTNDY